MAKLPLEGIRVLDLTVVWAGPFCTMFLGDMGAEIIRVENINVWQTNTRGFMARPPKALIEMQPGLGPYPNFDPGERPWNRHPLFNSHARNKLSWTVDLRKPEGIELFKRMVAISDVVIENNAVETMEKLGITYEMLSGVNPDIIYLRMPPYGTSGPYRNLRGFGSNFESVIGHTLLRTYLNTDPATNSPVYSADYLGGAQGAFAILAALHYRRRTGKGQYVEYAQTEGAMALMGLPFMDYALNGRVRTEGLGNRDPSAIQGCYRCRNEGMRPEGEPRDRWVCITVANDAEWAAFRAVLGDPAWARDARFADVASRYRHHDEIDKRISEWTAQRTSYEIMHALQANGIAAGPVMDSQDALSDPHLEARGFFKTVTQAETGTHRYPGPLFRFSTTPIEVRTPPVLLGEHNEYVYKELLGVSDEEYARLEAEGHIGMDFAPNIP